MGYGLMLAGLAMTSVEQGTQSWRTALTFGEELFAGWRRMCEMSRKSCQDDGQARCGGRLNKRTGETIKGFASCLPAWRFDDNLRSQQRCDSGRKDGRPLPLPLRRPPAR